MPPVIAARMLSHSPLSPIARDIKVRRTAKGQGLRQLQNCTSTAWRGTSDLRTYTPVSSSFELFSRCVSLVWPIGQASGRVESLGFRLRGPPEVSGRPVRRSGLKILTGGHAQCSTINRLFGQVVSDSF